MVPRLGPGQFIKGVLGKYRVEVVEVWRDVLFMICGLRVLLESFRQSLGNRSGPAYVFHLGEESSCPDSVTFFKRFIWEVGLWVRRLLGCRLGLVLLVGIFYEGWEGASPAGVYPFRGLGLVLLVGIFYEGWEGAGPAGVYPFRVLPLCVLFHLVVGLTADTAAREASGHFEGSGAEVDLRIVLVQPGEPEYHTLLAEAGDHEQNSFGMSVIGHDHVDDFADAPSLIKHSVHVVNWDRLGQLANWKFRSGDEVLVNEISGGTGINHGFHGCLFHSVCRLEMDREHNAFRT